MVFWLLGHVVGRQAIVVHEVLRRLSRLFNDNEDIVRRNAHRAIEMISETNLSQSVQQYQPVCDVVIYKKLIVNHQKLLVTSLCQTISQEVKQM